MAVVTVAIFYTVEVRWQDAEPAFARLPGAAERAIDELAARYRGSGVQFAGAVGNSDALTTRLDLVAHAEVEITSGWESIEPAIETAAKLLRQPLMPGSAVDPVPRALLSALTDATPRIQAVLPVRADDMDALRSGEGARVLVETAICHAFPQWTDQQERIARVWVTGLSDQARIRVEGESLELVREVAEAYLSPSWRRVTRPRSLVRPVPVWAWCSAATGVATFGLSWLPLSSGSLVALSAVGCAGVGRAVRLAARFGATRRASAWGIAPVVLLVVFAVLFGVLALRNGALVHTADDHALTHLRDPLLLSLSLMTTVGVLDLKLSGAARSFAYLEMLIVLGAVGGAGLVALRRASSRIEDAVRDIRRDQG